MGKGGKRSGAGRKPLPEGETEPVGISFPRDQLRALKEEAAREGLKLSALIRRKLAQADEPRS